MTNTPISLQDLRRNIYVKAKAEPSWRFWGLYVRSRNRRGFGWKRWSRHNLYGDLKLFNGYKVRSRVGPKVLPTQ
jgi:hypothetical protein